MLLSLPLPDYFRDYFHLYKIQLKSKPLVLCLHVHIIIADYVFNYFAQNVKGFLSWRTSSSSYRTRGCITDLKRVCCRKPVLVQLNPDLFYIPVFPYPFHYHYPKTYYASRRSPPIRLLGSDFIHRSAYDQLFLMCPHLYSHFQCLVSF
jgi:hypothetical protein